MTGRTEVKNVFRLFRKGYTIAKVLAGLNLILELKPLPGTFRESSSHHTKAKKLFVVKVLLQHGNQTIPVDSLQTPKITQTVLFSTFAFCNKVHTRLPLNASYDRKDVTETKR